MTDASTLYPEYTGGYGPYDYDPMIASFGDILLKVDDDDYQGDSRVLYKKDGLYGVLVFGWGSCSGCDALQGCQSVAELDELIADTRNLIRWADKEGTQAYLRDSEARKGEYSYHEKETREFYEKAIALLEEMP